MNYDDDYDDDFENSVADYCHTCGCACEDCECDDDIDGVGFADPGGRSALRAETESNPRRHPCPTCHAPDRLTDIDKAKGYQCDACADAAESGIDRSYECGGSEGGCPICKENEE